MSIQELAERINADSTILRIEKEIFYIEQLISLPRNEVLQNWKAFSEIIDRLYESHIQAFFEVNKNNIDVFLKFADWLVDLGKSLSDISEGTSLIEFADNFRGDPEDVFGKRAGIVPKRGE